MKTAAFRVDSSVEMGTGHVMRCLTLAEELKEEGYNSVFITREHAGNLSRYISARGFHLMMLDAPSAGVQPNKSLRYHHWLGTTQREDALETLRKIENLGAIDLMVIDHYGIDYRWESLIRMKGSIKRFLVIDDLANRKHDCDVLLDQNYYPDMEHRYKGLVNNDCILLLGPKYALLRKEFKAARKNLKLRSGNIRRILVFFGGTDPTNETMKVLEAISRLKVDDVIFDVIVGTSNPNRDAVKEMTNTMHYVNFYCQVTNMAEFMVNADLAIGAGGSTTWERCYIGLPALTIDVAENQSEILEALHARGVLSHIGKSHDVSVADFAHHFSDLLKNPDVIKHMSMNALELMSGEANNFAFLI